MKDNNFEADFKVEHSTLEHSKRDAPIKAFITNLGKYNEGELVGVWHPFPTTSEEIQATLKVIGIDGNRYEEFFITDYDSDNFSGVLKHLGEYENLDELNYLGAKLEELSGYEVDEFNAVLDFDISSVEEVINLTENIDCYQLYPDVASDYDLGYYYIEEAGIYDLKELGNLSNYFDYEKFGFDVRTEEGGYFTDNGYVYMQDSPDDFYHGYDDIPEEYKLSVYSEAEQALEDNKIKVLLVEPGKEAVEAEIDGSLSSMQTIVGGSIEATYPYEEAVVIVCNDEGKNESLPLNRALYGEDGEMYDIVAGSFFICGLGEDNFTSLSPELMSMFKEKFKSPEEFIKLAGKIMAVKMDEAKPKSDIFKPEKTKKDDLER